MHGEEGKGEQGRNGRGVKGRGKEGRRMEETGPPSVSLCFPQNSLYTLM